MYISARKENHYEFIERVGEEVKQLLNLQFNPNELAVAHGDKCYSQRDGWEKQGVPFNHGALIYLFTYMKPYSEYVRNTDDGWVNPHNWVIGFYKNNEELRNLLCSHSENKK